MTVCDVSCVIMEAEKLRELKCVDDINTFFDLNELSDMSDEEEIGDYISDELLST